MPRGGNRTPGEGKKLGRPKQARPTNANVAARVLARVRAEELWVEMIELEMMRLGLGKFKETHIDSRAITKETHIDSRAITKETHLDSRAITGPDYRGSFSIIPLTNLLRYQEDRAFGRPVDTVNHLHDKPIEMNVMVSLSEAIQKARKRAAER
jgi:hypothetical protein